MDLTPIFTAVSNDLGIDPKATVTVKFIPYARIPKRVKHRLAVDAQRVIDAALGDKVFIAEDEKEKVNA